MKNYVIIVNWIINILCVDVIDSYPNAAWPSKALLAILRHGIYPTVMQKHDQHEILILFRKVIFLHYVK